MTKNLRILTNHRDALCNIVEEKNVDIINLAAEKLSEIQETMRKYDLNEIVLADDHNGNGAYILPEQIRTERNLILIETEPTIYTANKEFMIAEFQDALWSFSDYISIDIADTIFDAEKALGKAIQEKMQDMYELGLPEPNHSIFFNTMDAYIEAYNDKNSIYYQTHIVAFGKSEDKIWEDLASHLYKASQPRKSRLQRAREHAFDVMRAKIKLENPSFFESGSKSK